MKLKIWNSSKHRLSNGKAEYKFTEPKTLSKKIKPYWWEKKKMLGKARNSDHDLSTGKRWELEYKLPNWKP